MRHDITDPNAPLGYRCGDAACREHGTRASERLVLMRDEGVRIEGWSPRLWLHYRRGRLLGWVDGWRR